MQWAEWAEWTSATVPHIPAQPQPGAPRSQWLPCTPSGPGLRPLVGDGELLPQFRTFAALYNSKVQQQQSLNQELRKQNELLKGAAPQDTQQRGYFRQLLQLLEAKADVYRRAAKIEAGLAADDEKDMAEYASYGGVNVMTLNDSSP